MCKKNGKRTINAQPFEEVMAKLDQQHEVQADESQPQGELPEIPALNDSPPDARNEAKAP
ncbi:putative transmembrane protein [Pasteurella multocida]|nr:putative transmembrane protein [Pasteurella multocida]